MGGPSKQGELSFTVTTIKEGDMKLVADISPLLPNEHNAHLVTAKQAWAIADAWANIASKLEREAK